MKTFFSLSLWTFEWLLINISPFYDDDFIRSRRQWQPNCEKSTRREIIFVLAQRERRRQKIICKAFAWDNKNCFKLMKYFIRNIARSYLLELFMKRVRSFMQECLIENRTSGTFRRFFESTLLYHWARFQNEAEHCEGLWSDQSWIFLSRFILAVCKSCCMISDHCKVDDPFEDWRDHREFWTKSFIIINGTNRSPETVKFCFTSNLELP